MRECGREFSGGLTGFELGIWGAMEQELHFDSEILPKKEEGFMSEETARPGLPAVIDGRDIIPSVGTGELEEAAEAFAKQSSSGQ